MKSFWLLLPLLSCTGFPPAGDSPLVDFIPPRLLEFTQKSNVLEFRFDEPVDRATVQLTEPQILGLTTTLSGTVLRAVLPSSRPLGVCHILLLEVADGRGNNLSVLQRFYPENPSLPGLQLTEARIAGDTSRPDQVELLVLENGNLAGGEVRDALPDLPGQSYVFPDVEVLAGQRIIIHFKPAGQPTEVDETGDTNQCQALGSVPGAWDFWVKAGTGLVGTNGLLLVLTRPDGEVVDALVYSNRTSLAQDKYGSFGSRSFQNEVRWVVEKGHWKATADVPVPEDCVDSSKSTPTRPLARFENRDSNTKEDWYTAALGSLGRKNTDQAWRAVRRG